MKTNDCHRHTYLLSLLLLVALWAVPGCQKQPTQQPTPTTLPELPTATVVKPTQGPTSAVLPDPQRATIEQVKQWMEQGVPLVILDSRSAADYAAAKTKVPGSVRVPPDNVEAYLSQIPRDRRIIAYCT